MTGAAASKGGEEGPEAETKSDLRRRERLDRAVRGLRGGVAAGRIRGERATMGRIRGEAKEERRLVVGTLIGPCLGDWRGKASGVVEEALDETLSTEEGSKEVPRGGLRAYLQTCQLPAR